MKSQKSVKISIIALFAFVLGASHLIAQAELPKHRAQPPQKEVHKEFKMAQVNKNSKVTRQNKSLTKAVSRAKPKVVVQRVPTQIEKQIHCAKNPKKEN